MALNKKTLQEHCSHKERFVNTFYLLSVELKVLADNFTVTVVAAISAYVMRALEFTAIGAFMVGTRFEAIVRAAHTAT